MDNIGRYDRRGSVALSSNYGSDFTPEPPFIDPVDLPEELDMILLRPADCLNVEPRFKHRFER